MERKLFRFWPFKKAEEKNAEDEIMERVNEGHENGDFEADEVEMIHNIFHLDDKEASDIMTHRTNIIAVEDSMPFYQVVDFILEENSSRFPVYHENIDNVIGILHMKDVMRIWRKGGQENTPIAEVEGAVRPAHFIPESQNITELFREMQSDKIHMEIVVDEYGQTAGLITMEDILEEIVGNIMDEYDEDENTIVEKSDGSYLVEGFTRLDDLSEMTGHDFTNEEFETLNGFLISKLNRIPKDNEFPVLDADGYHFEILKVDNNVIASVRMTKLPEEESDK